MFCFNNSGAMMSLMLLTAFCTPLPRYSVLTLSLSSSASWTPVEAPDGTAARKRPSSVTYRIIHLLIIFFFDKQHTKLYLVSINYLTRSTSTVGLPRESKIWRALIDLIGILKVGANNLLKKIVISLELFYIEYIFVDRNSIKKYMF